MKEFTTKEIVLIHTALTMMQIDVKEKNSLDLNTNYDEIQEIIWKVLKEGGK